MELILSQKLYDFTIWMTAHTSNYPKSHRFSYAVKIETLLLDTLILIEKANRSASREALMHRIELNLQSLRILIRLSKDLKMINLKSYEFAIKSLEEIGRIFGGWWKKTKMGNG